MRQVTLFFVAGLSLLFIALTTVHGEDPKPQKDTSQKPRPWSAKPPKDWPQLVLTNEATFEGHSPLKGASAFFIRMPDGEVLVATAKHLISEEGGLKPTVRLANFDQVFKSWKVYPKSKPKSATTAEGLGITSKDERDHDWLLVTLADPKAKRSATPLRPRREPAKVGETACLVGVPDADGNTSQNVYKGKVTERVDKAYFTIVFDPPVKLAGFSGAPIIDVNGYLLGVMKRGPVSERPDGLQNQCWGHDVSVAVDLWKKRIDASKVDPKNPIRIALPPIWIEEKSVDKNNIITARHPGLGALVKLIAQPRKNAPADLTLMSWGEHVKGGPIGGELQDRQLTELATIKLHGRETVQFDLTGKTRGLPIRYRMILFEFKSQLCMLICSAPEENWSKTEPYFEDAFAAIE